MRVVYFLCKPVMLSKNANSHELFDSLCSFLAPSLLYRIVLIPTVLLL